MLEKELENDKNQKNQQEAVQATDLYGCNQTYAAEPETELEGDRN